jgi:transposase
MAFLREEKKKSGTYIRIVESFRENGKPSQRTLYNLGKVEDYAPEQLKRIGARLFKLGGGDLRELIGGATKELGRFNYGYFQVYSKYFKLFGLGKIFKKISSDHELSYDLSDAILLLLLERLNEPCSKLASYNNQSEYLGLPQIELHNIYRSLDYLTDNHKLIQDIIFSYGRDMFNQSLDLVFYDVTTFYFDSQVSGGLRQKGFGKDGKVGKTQVVFGLMIDKEQRPIGYQIYDGKFYEGHTFVDAVDKLKSRYNIDKVIVVADRGMMNKDNIKAVEAKNGYEYIVGERLKSLPRKVKEDLINLDNYKKTWTYNKDNEQINIRYTTLDYDGKKIICTFSENRAKKDFMERDEKIKKAEVFIKSPSKLKGKEKHYYLKNINKETFALDEEKIAEASRYDGFIAIATNNKDLSEAELLDNYRHLYKVEQSFRKFKTHLETRPMYHWTDIRIRGHLCLCYIAYALNNQILLDMKQANEPMSENELRKSLDKMQASLIEQRKEQFYLRANLDENEKKITQILKLPKLPCLTPKANINKYLA